MITYFKYLCISLLIFITPIQGLMMLVSFAVGFDTLFAIFTSVKLKGWSSFSSTKLFNIVVKTFFYMGTILFAYLIDTHILHNTFLNVPNLISKAITMVWLYIEIKSIDETSMKLGNRSFWEILKELINRTKDVKRDINEI